MVKKQVEAGGWYITMPTTLVVAPPTAWEEVHHGVMHWPLTLGDTNPNNATAPFQA